MEDARSKLHDLTEQKLQVDRIAEPPNTYAFWRARRNIERGRLEHEVDSADQEAGADGQMG
jgi:hypothetical protein